MKNKYIDNGLTPKENDFEYLDMMGLTDEELLKIMTPEDLKEMKEYLEKKNQTPKNPNLKEKSQI